MIGYGFHEDGFKSGMAASNALLKGSWKPLPNAIHFPIKTSESIARMAVLSFFKKFIKSGQLNICEVGGSVESFGSMTSSAYHNILDDEENLSASSSCSSFTMASHFPTPSSTSLATPHVRTAAKSSLFAGVANKPSTTTPTSPSTASVISSPSGRNLLAPPCVNITIRSAQFYTKVAFRADLGTSSFLTHRQPIDPY
jgi:hypothetical protein